MALSKETQDAIDAFVAIVRAERAFARASRRVPEDEVGVFYEALQRDPTRSIRPWDDYELDLLVRRFLEEVEELIGFPVVDWAVFQASRQRIVESLKQRGQDDEPYDVACLAMSIHEALGKAPVTLSREHRVAFKESDLDKLKGICKKPSDKGRREE